MPFNSPKVPPSTGKHRQMVLASLDALGHDIGKLMLEHKSRLHGASHDPEKHHGEPGLDHEGATEAGPAHPDKADPFRGAETPEEEAAEGKPVESGVDAEVHNMMHNLSAGKMGNPVGLGKKKFPQF